MSAHPGPDRLIIAANGVCATILPTVGGSLGSLTWHSRNLLRPAVLAVGDARDTACFPLLPFANRIANCQFSMDGTCVRLPNAGPGAPHALHGIGWTTSWQVEVAADDHAELRLEHDDAAWPWRFEARQIFRLVDRGICISLELTNCDSRPMPSGIGFHPYFERTPATHLHMQVARAWTSDDRGIAAISLGTASVGHLNGGVRVETLAGEDLCCGGWTRHALVDQGEMKIAVEASPAISFLHLYIPEEAPFFCAEPVSHAPDAINRADVPPMTVLAPGATLSAWMLIRAAA